MSHSLIQFISFQVTLDRWTHTCSFDHNYTQLTCGRCCSHSLPDLLQTSHPLLQPSAESIEREGPFNTARANAHTYTQFSSWVGTETVTALILTQQVIVWTVIWGQEAVGWFVVLSKIHTTSAPFISSCHKRKKSFFIKAIHDDLLALYLPSDNDVTFILLEYDTHK